MPRKKKSYNIKTRVTSALRRIWLWSPQRREAIKRARDNGNKCENKKCTSTDSKLTVDHIVPVVPLKGFDSWDGYIERLMVDANGLRVWCSECHNALTEINRKQRQLYKKRLTKK